MTVEVNVWAILVSSVVNMGVGVVWYSPVLFGTSWTRLSGAKMDEGTGRMVEYAGAYFSGLILAAILALVLSMTGIQTVWEGLIVALVVWLGFTAAPAFANTIFESRPFGLWGINSAYPLVSIVLMTVILVVWR